MFFSNNIYVASVYSGPLNTHLIDFKKPYHIGKFSIPLTTVPFLSLYLHHENQKQNNSI
jgi:hypothetical protein